MQVAREPLGGTGRGHGCAGAARALPARGWGSGRHRDPGALHRERERLQVREGAAPSSRGHALEKMNPRRKLLRQVFN